MADYQILGSAADKKPKSQYQIIEEDNAQENEDPGAYLDALPKKNEFKAPGDILGGLTNAGRNLHNMPHDIVKGLEEATQSAGKMFDILPGKSKTKGKSISDYLPYDPNDYLDIYGINKDENTLLDSVLQKGAEYSPEIIGGIKALAKLPITKYPGVKALNKVKEGIANRDVGKLNIPEHIFRDIEENKFLNNTQANRNLLSKAKEGRFQDLFDLQSDLGGLERSYTRDIFNAANRQFGKDIGTTRQDLLNFIKNELSNLGHGDLAEDLSKGQNLYRQYMKFRPYRNAALGLAASSIPGYSILKKLML